MELYSDTYYIQRVLAGDTACFACLIDRYGEPIHALILKVVRNPEDAEELAQDTFLKAFKSLGTFKGDCGFSTWLYRIAYNTALSSLRKKRPEYLMIDESTIEQVSGDTIEELVIDQLEERAWKSDSRNSNGRWNDSKRRSAPCSCSITGRKSRSTRSQRSLD